MHVTTLDERDKTHTHKQEISNGEPTLLRIATHLREQETGCRKAKKRGQKKASLRAPALQPRVPMARGVVPLLAARCQLHVASDGVPARGLRQRAFNSYPGGREYFWQTVQTLSSRPASRGGGPVIQLQSRNLCYFSHLINAPCTARGSLI